MWEVVERRLSHLGLFEPQGPDTRCNTGGVSKPCELRWGIRLAVFAVGAASAVGSVGTGRRGFMTAATVEVGKCAVGALEAASAAVAAGTLVTCARAGCLSPVRRFGTIEESNCSNLVKEFILRTVSLGGPRILPSCTWQR